MSVVIPEGDSSRCANCHRVHPKDKCSLPTTGKMKELNDWWWALATTEETTSFLAGVSQSMKKQFELI